MVHHELAVVFAERAFDGAIARIGRVGAARPLPDDAERIVELAGPGGDLPFHFGRHVLAGPARVGVGLVVADMADRGVRIDRLQAAEGHDLPGAVDLPPVAGGLPVLAGGGRETVHQPQCRGAVAAIGHEGHPLAVGDEIARQLHRADQRAVRRLLVVEMEGIGLVSDAVDALGQRDLGLAVTLRCGKRPVGVIGRGDRIAGEGVQDVGQHQFLVLLLMIEADLHQGI